MNPAISPNLDSQLKALREFRSNFAGTTIESPTTLILNARTNLKSANIGMASEAKIILLMPKTRDFQAEEDIIVLPVPVSGSDIGKITYRSLVDLVHPLIT